MKKLFCLLFVFLPALLIAQSVGINNDGSQPNSTAMLDIKSNSKGILIPRMTSAERLAIVSPATGLMVFDTETLSFWMYRSILYGWGEIQHSFLKNWTETGSHIYNTNAGNVGIGTNTPASKLTINGIDPVIGIMNNGLAHSYIQASGSNMRINTPYDNPVGKLILGTRDNDHVTINSYGQVSIGTSSAFDAELKLNGNSSVRFALMHQDVAKGFLALNYSDFRIGTYNIANSRIVFSPKGTDRVFIDEDGKVGIGTGTPVSDLTISGNNPYIELQNAGVNKGFFQNVGNDIRLGTNSTNTTGNLVFQTKLLDRMLIDENGKVGIGTTTPSTVLTVNGTDPILQLRNDNVDKGFVQLVGSDIKVGTNANNDYGNLYFRTNGADRMMVNYYGNVGIGTNWAYYTMSLNATEPAVGFSVSDQQYALIKVDNPSRDFIIQKTTLGNGKLIIDAGGSFRWTMNEDNHINYGYGQHPVGYLMSIQGKILATDFTALAVPQWPDYVFGDEYKLWPLADVKKFIEENKHLPNIPSAKEIEKNGVQLGDMSKRLMEKVEELTLYILQLQEQVDELKKKDQARNER